MSDLERYVNDRIVDGHCDCMFLYNTYRWEWTTIAALAAPRPMLFANSDHDPIFPMDGNVRIVDRLRGLYELYGQPEHLAVHVSPGGHDYRPDLRMAVFRWMNTHLKHESGPVQDALDPPVDGKHLRVFPEDKDLPTDARNAQIDESFVVHAKRDPPPADGFERWRSDRLHELRGLSFRTFPDRLPAARPRDDTDAGMSPRWVKTEPGIEVAVLDLRSRKPTAARGTLIVLDEGETLDGIPAWARSINDEDAVVVLAPRGVGPTSWERKSPPNYIERAHALLGRTVDQGRVWDAAAVARWLASPPGGTRRWRIAGAHRAGIIAAYAAVFEPSIEEVLILDPPASHRAGPIFLNVLQVLDIPSALGLLAPRPLTIQGTKADAFEVTRNLYNLAGAGPQLEWKPSR